MKTVIATVEGISPYSQSRAYEAETLQGESANDKEVRTWRQRLHVDADGMVFIPPMAFKNALAETAKFLSIGIPGKGKSTYTKHFEAGVLAFQPVSLGIRADEVDSERLFVPADGVRGSGKRVYKLFPVIHPGWTAQVEFMILDDTVLQTGADGRPVFQTVLEKCGQFVGIGRFRPRNNGFYGRFAVRKFEVIDAA